jgi:hypothetical protein
MRVSMASLVAQHVDAWQAASCVLSRIGRHPGNSKMKIILHTTINSREMIGMQSVALLSSVLLKSKKGGWT